MPAIISDQFRVLNAENFVKSVSGVGDTSNKYYTFIGLPNSTNPAAGGSPTWTSNTPSPVDGFKEEYQVKESIISLKQITNQDVRRLVRKVTGWLEILMKCTDMIIMCIMLPQLHLKLVCMKQIIM